MAPPPEIVPRQPLPAVNPEEAQRDGADHGAFAGRTVKLSENQFQRLREAFAGELHEDVKKALSGIYDPGNEKRSLEAMG